MIRTILHPYLFITYWLNHVSSFFYVSTTSTASLSLFKSFWRYFHNDWLTEEGDFFGVIVEEEVSVYIVVIVEWIRRAGCHLINNSRYNLKSVWFGCHVVYKYDTSFTITLQYHNTELSHYTIPQYRAITLHNTTIQSYYSTHYRAITLRITELLLYLHNSTIKSYYSTQSYNTELLHYTIPQYRAITLHNTTNTELLYFTE